MPTQKPDAAPKEDIPLTQLILDRSKDKYRLVALALRWAQEIKQKEQAPEPPQEILSRALKQILDGDVSLEEIEKLPPLPKPAEPKAPALVLKPLPEKDEPEEKPEKSKKSKD